MILSIDEQKDKILVFAFSKFSAIVFSKGHQKLEAFQL